MSRFVVATDIPRVLDRDEVAEMMSDFRRTRTAAVVNDFEFKPGFVYNTVRAISARINQNFDAWPSEELKKAYKTFLGKPCFVNHRNEDWRLARGRVVAARYIENGNDKYIDVIQETDGTRFPILASEIITGGMDSVSMGVEAGFTICSICENRATDVFDMCGHVKFHKGEYLHHPKTGKKTLVYENCHKLGFFELSYVFDPADETAVISRVISAARKTAAEDESWYRQAAPAMGVSSNPVPPVFKGLAPTTGDTSFHQPTVGIGSGAGVSKGPTPGSIKEPDGPSFVPGSNVHYDSTPDDGSLFPSLFGSRKRDRMSRFEAHWLRQAFAETTVPKEVDTLRDESEDDGDPTGTFHNWIPSPAELQDPDTEKAHQLDRHQEDQGLDGDRHAEDVEDVGAPGTNDHDWYDDEDLSTAMPINPPASKRGRRTINRGAAMPRNRRYYAADEDQDPQGFPPEDDGSEDGYGDDGGAPDDGSDQDYDASDGGGGEDPDQLVQEAEDDLAQYDQQGSGDDYGDGGDEGDGDDYGDSAPEDSFGGDDQGAPPEEDPAHADADDDLPPWLQDGGNRESRRKRPVKKKSGRGNRRAPQGGEMPRQSLATRQRTAQQLGNKGRRHFQADESGHTDGGPYGVDDSQGAQEDIFISQVPAAEAVETADGEPISNTPNNLVASAGQFDPNHYQRLADVIAAMPVAERRAMALKMASQFKRDNPRFNELTFYKTAKCRLVRRGNRIFFAEDLVDPDKVDPALSGTDAQDQKGSDFESLALDNVETQPKDASIHAFRQFDAWLQNATGRTARQHGNANFIRRAAVSYARATSNPQRALEGLFPTLDYVLAGARKVEAGRTAMNRYADESLDVAAPDGRIDVEAPVRNVTDADAQSSQFDLGDFADNAGDGLADPDLEPVRGNAGTWAPDEGKEASTKLASSSLAMRCAEAHIAAMPHKYPKDSRWQLTAQFETLREPVVRDRLKLCEAMIENNKIAARRSARKVTAASSRGTNGLPVNFGQRSAAVGMRQGSAAPHNDDSSIFF